MVDKVFLQQHTDLRKLTTRLLLPSANEVCEGYVFTPVCQSFCFGGGGVCLSTCWDTQYPLPQEDTSPGSRHPPADPPGQQPSQSRHPLVTDTPHHHPHPQEQCMLGDMDNKWAVRILLECILVSSICSDSSNTKIPT